MGAPVGPGGGDDLVPVPPAQAEHGPMDRARAGAVGQGVLLADPGGVLSLELRRQLPVGHAARLEHPQHRLPILVSDDRPAEIGRGFRNGRGAAEQSQLLGHGRTSGNRGRGGGPPGPLGCRPARPSYGHRRQQTDASGGLPQLAAGRGPEPRPPDPGAVGVQSDRSSGRLQRGCGPQAALGSPGFVFDPKPVSELGGGLCSSIGAG